MLCYGDKFRSRRSRGRCRALRSLRRLSPELPQRCCHGNVRLSRGSMSYTKFLWWWLYANSRRTFCERSLHENCLELQSQIYACLWTCRNYQNSTNIYNTGTQRLVAGRHYLTIWNPSTSHVASDRKSAAVSWRWAPAGDSRPDFMSQVWMLHCELSCGVLSDERAI
jgi:hypothetical protein